MRKYRLEEMSSDEIHQAIANGIRTIVIMLGSTEQHGDHLPISTDSLIADEIGKRIVTTLGNALLAPTIRVGVSEHHMSFSGTISIRKNTLISIITDYCSSVTKHGFKNVVIIPTHSGNCKAVEEAVKHLQVKIKEANFIGFSDLMDYFKPIFGVAAKYKILPQVTGVHAGEWETSMVLSIRPDLVEMNKATKGYIGDLEKARAIVFQKGIKALTANGVVGDPTSADAERGKVYLSHLAEFFVKYVRKRMKAILKGEE